MNIGFTGTRAGMSSAQLKQLDAVLCYFRCDPLLMPHTFHYGTHDAVELKADLAAARMAEAGGGYRVQPWAATRGTELARDRALVACIDLLIAAPAEDKEQLRSGTWATIRYARARKLPIIFLTR